MLVLVRIYIYTLIKSLKTELRKQLKMFSAVSLHCVYFIKPFLFSCQNTQSESDVYLLLFIDVEVETGEEFKNRKKIASNFFYFNPLGFPNIRGHNNSFL